MLERIHRVFKRLPAQFVSAKMISLGVRNRRRFVRVHGKVVQF